MRSLVLSAIQCINGFPLFVISRLGLGNNRRKMREGWREMPVEGLFHRVDGWACLGIMCTSFDVAHNNCIQTKWLFILQIVGLMLKLILIR
jgi:hypothetical protein